MGIPSYFSYIVKNHPAILKQIQHNIMNVDNFYLDCNSVIYDVIHNIDFKVINTFKNYYPLKIYCIFVLILILMLVVP